MGIGFPRQKWSWPIYDYLGDVSKIQDGGHFLDLLIRAPLAAKICPIWLEIIIRGFLESQNLNIESFLFKASCKQFLFLCLGLQHWLATSGISTLYIRSQNSVLHICKRNSAGSLYMIKLICEFGHREMKFFVAKPVWRNSLATKNGQIYYRSH